MTRFTFRDMDLFAVKELSSWQYQPPYDFYDSPADFDHLDDDELYAPARWGVSSFVADAHGELAGFFELLPSGDVVEIGLGLRPDLTGHGHGFDFVQAILDFARERHAPREFRLKVAAFNKRAISVYERAGFTVVRESVRHVDGNEWPFIEMTRLATV